MNNFLFCIMLITGEKCLNRIEMEQYLIDNPYELVVIRVKPIFEPKPNDQQI